MAALLFDESRDCIFSDFIFSVFPFVFTLRTRPTLRLSTPIPTNSTYRSRTQPPVCRPPLYADCREWRKPLRKLHRIFGNCKNGRTGAGIRAGRQSPRRGSRCYGISFPAGCRPCPDPIRTRTSVRAAGVRDSCGSLRDASASAPVRSSRASRIANRADCLCQNLQMWNPRVAATPFSIGSRWHSVPYLSAIQTSQRASASVSEIC